MRPRAGDSVAGRYWNDQVEGWFMSNPQIILEYPYHVVDFTSDLDIWLPPRDAWS